MPVCVETPIMAANLAAAFFYLIGDNRTDTLALTSPAWGRPLAGLSASGGFQMSDWHCKTGTTCSRANHSLITRLINSSGRPQYV